MGVRVRVRAVNDKAHEINNSLFHVCFKLCSYYKHSNLLVARLTYWTIQVCNQPIWQDNGLKFQSMNAFVAVV